jgi:hypothetical protein
MKNTYWYIAGIGLIAYLIMGTNKAFSKVTTNNIFRGCDPKGCGEFGAPRGSRTHIGLDIKAVPGEVIFSPISGKVTRFPFPYGNDLSFTGIEIVNNQYKVKIFYMKANVPANSTVKQGQVIGNAQDIAKKHGGGMINHIHLEVYDNVGKLIDPKILF